MANLTVQNRFIAFTICMLSSIAMMAQGISGTIADTQKESIIGASVVLQTADAAFIEACVTNAEGRFSFKKKMEKYRLIIQHISYKTKQLTITDGNLPAVIILEEKSENLKEIVVKATRPIVKVNDNGGLVYSAKQLVANRPVTNGLDLLEEVPGIVKNGDNLSIVGAGSTNIFINGHKRSMSVDDLKQLLASTPPSQIKSVEVFYNTPPQYGVKGGSINVVMDEKRSEKTSWNGNVHTALYAGNKYYQTGGFDFNLFQSKWSLGIGYGLGNINKNYKEQFESSHTVGDETTLLNMDTHRNSYRFRHQIKTSFSYDFNKTSKMSILYILDLAKQDNHAFSPLKIHDQLSTESNSAEDGNDLTHTFNLEFVHKRMAIGGDFVYFDSDRKQQMNNNHIDVEDILNSNTTQRVKKGNLYFNNSHGIGIGTLSYGWNANLSESKSSYMNEWSNQSTKEDNISNQNEYSIDVFAGWNQKLGKKSTLSAYVTAQYYHADMKSQEEKSTLWNGIYFFPSVTFNHRINQSETVTFTFSSERKYPRFTATSNRKTYHNSYLYYLGNPSLKPCTSYESHLNYVYKGKYIFGLFANMRPKYSTQQIYQDPDILEASYRYFNIDYCNQFGILGVIPQKWNNFIDSRLTVNLYYSYQKGELIDVPFDKDEFTGIFNISNNFSLNKAKTWVLQLNASYQSEAIQGLYDNKPMFNSSLALAWNPKKSGWNLALKANDLFNTSNQKLTVDYANQHYKSNTDRDSRYVSFTARYAFNNYKQKKERQIDTSRMGL